MFKAVSTILTLERLAAPESVIFSLPTVKIISSPLFSEEAAPPAIESVDVELNPVIKSLPSL